MTQIIPGDEQILLFNFETYNNVPADPDTIAVSFIKPDGELLPDEIEKTDMTNPDEGDWRAVYTFDVSGRWQARVVTTGVLKKASEFIIDVAESDFV